MSITYSIWPHPCLMEWAIKKYSKGVYQERLLRGCVTWGYDHAHSDPSYGSSRSTLLKRIRGDGQLNITYVTFTDKSGIQYDQHIRKFYPLSMGLVLMVEIALAQEKK